ncbi:MAG: rcp1 2 [Bacteroidetes bacterium]|nr:rcp1 2 [Bacteroidota bacterium]
MKLPLRIMLADDDADDRFFFDESIKSASTPAVLNTVDNGEKLIQYLTINKEALPHALFLDLNMPRKNGAECLLAIKKDEQLQDLPVIIYSTSLHQEIADTLYNNGAHYYIKKGHSAEMQSAVNYILKLITDNNLVRPTREQFILNPKKLTS